ncbi:MAG: phage tail protein [Deltaproteobacteria bacterium]|jgi:phage tail sheath gpL-like|nr:phage tail protein [Deltaproteobacteria bacterium]
MAISFDQIPTNWRVPLIYAEIDPTQADQAAPAMPYRVLVLGQATATLAPVLAPQRVTSAAQAVSLFGAGSLLAAQAEAWFGANTTTEVYYVSVPEPEGAKATLLVTLTGTATTGGTISLYIGDDLVSVYVPPSTTAAVAATALIGAINAHGGWSAVAGGEAGKLTISAPSKGTVYNGVTVRVGYYQEQALPEGLSIAYAGTAPAPASPSPTYKISASLAGLIAFYGNQDPARPFQSLTIPGILPPLKNGLAGQLAGGSGVPDLAPLFAALGDDDWYHFFVSPWTDSATLAALKEEAERRFNAMLDKPTHIICAANGTHAQLGALGALHNSPHLTILGAGGPFTKQENNLLLFDGISTYYVNPDGGMTVERLITTYRENAWGAADRAYLDLNTLLTLAYLRYSYKTWMARIFPRHKLCDDSANFGVGQAITTPSIIKGETFAWFQSMEELGLVENADAFKDALIVERDPSDVCRVNIKLPPNLVNQLRVMAAKISFRL